MQQEFDGGVCGQVFSDSLYPDLIHALGLALQGVYAKHTVTEMRDRN